MRRLRVRVPPRALGAGGVHLARRRAHDRLQGGRAGGRRRDAPVARLGPLRAADHAAGPERRAAPAPGTCGRGPRGAARRRERDLGDAAERGRFARARGAWRRPGDRHRQGHRRGARRPRRGAADDALRRRDDLDPQAARRPLGAAPRAPAAGVRATGRDDRAGPGAATRQRDERARPRRRLPLHIRLPTRWQSWRRCAGAKLIAHRARRRAGHGGALRTWRSVRSSAATRSTRRSSRSTT